MRVWAEVFDPLGRKVASIDRVIDASAMRRLDAAGSWSMQCAMDERVLSHLTTGNTVAIYVEQQGRARLWTRGRIGKRRVEERESAFAIHVSGHDEMDELRYPVVGIGRVYQAQTIQAIMSDLVGLAPGWSVSVDAATASRLQTVRLDGAKVLRALVRMADELGVHFRAGFEPRTLEVGVFGDAAPARAIKPPSTVGIELYDNTDVLLIEEMTVEDDIDDVINWVIPLGAGEGAAALSLKYTSYRILNDDNSIYRTGIEPDYPIYRRVNSSGNAEYFIDGRTGGETARQETVTFKEIGPVANSDAAKQIASDALARAAFEYLRRRKQPLRTYKLTATKDEALLKPGQLMRVTYRGFVQAEGEPTASGSRLTYIDVDEPLWIVGIQRTISDSGQRTDLEVSNIDRVRQDDKDILVEVLETVDAQNVAVKSIVCNYSYSASDSVQWNTGNPDRQKRARFPLVISDKVTEIISVTLNFFTRPLSTTATFDHYNGLAPNDTFLGSYAYGVRKSTHYPVSIRLFINGVNVTTVMGGPWATIDAETLQKLDITEYITGAEGGIYQTHWIEFECSDTTGTSLVHTVIGSTSSTNISNGVIDTAIDVLAVTRATAPTE